MKISSFLPSVLALTATAQTTLSYTDPKSSITFQAFQDPSGYTFGIALPTTPSTDFVGLLVGEGTGWAGVSLGGAMANKLLIAAWGNGNEVISSFRRVDTYTSPPEVTGPFSITPLANGTYVNATHYALTFLCSGCILNDGSTFSSNDTNAVLGWALSGTAPATKANHSSQLAYHNNMGNYGMDLGAAKGLWAGSGPKLRRREPIKFRGVSGLRI